MKSELMTMHNRGYPKIHNREWINKQKKWNMDNKHESSRHHRMESVGEMKQFPEKDNLLTMQDKPWHKKSNEWHNNNNNGPRHGNNSHEDNKNWLNENRKNSMNENNMRQDTSKHLNKESDKQDLHKESDKQDLHKDSNKKDLHKDSNKKDLHKDSNKKDLHKDSNKKDLHKDSNKKDLHKQATKGIRNKENNCAWCHESEKRVTKGNGWNRSNAMKADNVGAEGESLRLMEVRHDNIVKKNEKNFGNQNNEEMMLQNSHKKNLRLNKRGNSHVVSTSNYWSSANSLLPGHDRTQRVQVEEKTVNEFTGEDGKVHKAGVSRKAIAEGDHDKGILGEARVTVYNDGKSRTKKMPINIPAEKFHNWEN